MFSEKQDSTIVLNELKVIRRVNIVDELYEQLKELILSEKIPPGTMLPSEYELSEHMGVGRSTVREALRILATLGLIVRSKRGTFVNSDIKNLHESLPFPEILKQIRLGDIIEFRTILEGEIAVLAATNATDEDVQYISAVVDKMKESRNDLNEFTKYDYMFHLSLAKASQNELIECVMEMIHEPIESVMLEANILDVDKRNRSIVEHGKY
jgi:GntR family transcriptional repressor for pyruvate dehydrogenase complex